MSGRSAEPAAPSAGTLLASADEELSLGQRRRFILLLALAGVVTVGLLILLEALLHDGEGRHQRTSFSTRADGYRGILEVLKRLGFAVERQRRSYAQLPPPEESVLVIIDPLDAGILSYHEGTRLDAAQRRALGEWVAQGGRVIAGPAGRSAVHLFGLEVDTSPDFAGSGENVIQGLGGGMPAASWAPLSGRVRGEGELRAVQGSWREPAVGKESLVAAHVRREGGTPGLLPRLEKAGGGPLEITVFEEGLPAPFEAVCFLESRPVAAAAREGDGRIWLLSSSFPFTNLAVAESGTAQLLASLADVATENGRRTLVFDEYCHGLAVRRGLFGWVLETSLFYPVAAALLLFAALAWRGAARLGAPRAERTLPRRAKEEFVISLADILRRARRYRAAAAWIIDAHAQRLAGGGRAADGAALAAAARRLEGRRRAVGEKELAEIAGAADEAYRRASGGSRAAAGRSQRGATA
jgi:hypothetical protein